jgi:hypothetical protein
MLELVEDRPAISEMRRVGLEAPQLGHWGAGSFEDRSSWSNCRPHPLQRYSKIGTA